jgi:hypothetical protein
VHPLIRIVHLPLAHRNLMMVLPVQDVGFTYFHFSNFKDHNFLHIQALLSCQQMNFYCGPQWELRCCFSRISPGVGFEGLILCLSTTSNIFIIEIKKCLMTLLAKLK